METGQSNAFVIKPQRALRLKHIHEFQQRKLLNVTKRFYFLCVVNTYIRLPFNLNF